MENKNNKKTQELKSKYQTMAISAFSLAENQNITGPLFTIQLLKRSPKMTSPTLNKSKIIRYGKSINFVKNFKERLLNVFFKNKLNKTNQIDIIWL